MIHARDGIPNVGGAVRPSKIPTPHWGSRPRHERK